MINNSQGVHVSTPAKRVGVNNNATKVKSGFDLYKNSFLFSDCGDFYLHNDFVNRIVQSPKPLKNRHFSRDNLVFDELIDRNSKLCSVSLGRLSAKSPTKDQQQLKPKTGYSPGKYLVLTLSLMLIDNSQKNSDAANIQKIALHSLRNTIPSFLATIVNIESGWKGNDSVYLTEDGVLKTPIARGICARFKLHPKYFGKFIDAITTDLISQLNLGVEIKFKHGEIRTQKNQGHTELIICKLPSSRLLTERTDKPNQVKLLNLDGFSLS